MIISWGIFLVLTSWAIRGTLVLDVQTPPVSEVEIEDGTSEIIIEDGGKRVEQKMAPGSSVRMTSEGVEIRKGGPAA